MGRCGGGVGCGPPPSDGTKPLPLHLPTSRDAPKPVCRGVQVLHQVPTAVEPLVIIVGNGGVAPSPDLLDPWPLGRGGALARGSSPATTAWRPGKGMRRGHKAPAPGAWAAHVMDDMVRCVNVRLLSEHVKIPCYCRCMCTHTHTHPHPHKVEGPDLRIQDLLGALWRTQA